MSEINNTESTAVATRSQSGAMARFSADQIRAASFENGAAIPDLRQAEVIPLPVGTEYWSPENEGESKRVFVAGVGPTDIVDPQTGEVKQMGAVFLLEVGEDGKARKWMNAGRVLVGNISDAIKRGQIVPGTALTPVQITYLGTKKNRNNAKLSRRWEILPLAVAGVN
jgi:hypothetical protein